MHFIRVFNYSFNKFSKWVKVGEKFLSDSNLIEINIIDRQGVTHKLYGKTGQSVLELAHSNHIDLEGACEASLACSTCHVYVDESFSTFIQEPCEKEEDMLDMAPLIRNNSRLGCQIILNKYLNGCTLTIPKFSRNMYVDKSPNLLSHK